MQKINPQEIIKTALAAFLHETDVMGGTGGAGIRAALEAVDHFGLLDKVGELTDDIEELQCLRGEEAVFAREANAEIARLRNANAGMLKALGKIAELRRRWRSQDEDETIDSIEYMDWLDAVDVEGVIALAREAA